ncbi:MAG: hypothetical protein KDB53_07055, partial [Planctomycetes bacterium]|nr:hypothetical protein [Planctomycetota bacterium]
MNEPSKKPLRIAGLVKARRQVEDLLVRGDASSVDRARRLAMVARDEVQSICELRGSTPMDLPPPSRKAFAYLDSVAGGKDAEASALTADIVGVMTPSSPRVGRVKEKAHELGRLMWRRYPEILKDRELLQLLEDKVSARLAEVTSQLFGRQSL